MTVYSGDMMTDPLCPLSQYRKILQIHKFKDEVKIQMMIKEMKGLIHDLCVKKNTMGYVTGLFNENVRHRPANSSDCRSCVLIRLLFNC